ncbi:DUF1302 domain-containing protein [Duganella sp. LX20W]|uniref:DUF1302 domain-containing protein n=1 Tax=Rugamonas brunnea TaxID=2758569 RepID=A0A7W2IE42_9BURK|nr:DUF1302 domain-containing protein [Rugamonas brunnea]MBA5640079.1 DUF1302 domain-containing protein [Rugamonas brunnea]
MQQVHTARGHLARTRFKRGAAAQACAAAIALIGAAHPGMASAGDFSLDNGIDGQWSFGTSVGSSWRAREADPALIGIGNGGRSIGQNDDGNLNYGKGAAFSTIAKFNGEVKLKKDNFGVVIGAKGWYDYAGERKRVAHGSFANGYAADTALDDAGFDTLSKFSGIALDNAYGFGTVEVAKDMPLSVKLGNHVVNWGESLFIPGINQFGAFDITAANRPGAQVKEILLPIPQASATLSLPNGVNLEAFYQFAWKKNILDGCGTYWSLSDFLNCPGGAVAGGDPLPDQLQYNGVPPAPGLPPFNFRLGRAPDNKPKSSGQFGLAARYQVAAIDTDLGVYFANYHARNPIYSLVKSPSPGASVWSGALALAGGPGPLQFQWDYAARDIRVLGMSASTAVAGWSLSGEASFTKDVPVQINTTDLTAGAALGVGPLARLAATPAGGAMQGYDLKNKAQAQVSTVKIFPQVAAAESLTLIGELAYQHWSGMGDPATTTRYGRASVFGLAQTATIPCAFTGNPNPANCEDKGFFTSNAWGYRLQAELSYPDVFAGVNLKPRLFWSQDVKGYSADNTFVEDRQVLGLALRADYNNRYYADVSYTRYNHGAKYDVLHDRDYYSAVVGINF